MRGQDLVTTPTRRVKQVTSLLTIIALMPCLQDFAQADSLHQSKPANAVPVILKSMEAKLDTSDESPKTESQRLNARIEELRNLDIVDPKSDWNRAYSIGRQAYIDGDFRRAFNAFQLALMRMDNVAPEDPRVAMTRAAIKQIGANARTPSARAGYKAVGNKILTVFPGSLAWLAGVRSGDGILSAKASGSLIDLTINRNGRSHVVALRDLSASDAEQETHPRLKAHADEDQTSLTKMQPSMDKDRPLKGHVLDFQLLAQNERLLDNHDLVILIDKSGSMREDASPGVSKWEWCKNNTLNLLETAGKHFENKITIVPFDTRFQVFDNADLSKVASIYQEFSPMGGTRPDGALAFELDEYFAKRQKTRNIKPLIVAVLTDGLPNDPDALRDVIFDATMRMQKPDEICITFLQIGESFSGSRILTALDDYLVDAGARYDIVDTTTFFALQKIGIKNALISALMMQQPAAGHRK
jgi:Mg-chelatase subunit ChlD